MTGDKRKSRRERIRNFRDQPPTPARRITAGLLGAAGAGLATWLIFALMIPGAPEVLLWIALVAGVLGGGYAAATTRWGYGMIFGVVSIFWLGLEIIAAVLGALFSGIG